MLLNRDWPRVPSNFSSIELSAAADKPGEDQAGSDSLDHRRPHDSPHVRGEIQPGHPPHRDRDQDKADADQRPDVAAAARIRPKYDHREHGAETARRHHQPGLPLAGA